MNIIVIDNAIEENFLELMKNYIFHLPHTYSEYSAEDADTSPLSNGHLAHNFENNWLNGQLYNKIAQYVQKEIDIDAHNCYRFHTNMHFPDVGGRSYHRDKTVLTAVLCMTDHDGGAFEYIDYDGNVQKIEDKKNRIIMFQEPEMHHRAIPPNSNDNGPRITVAVKYVPIGF